MTFQNEKGFDADFLLLTDAETDKPDEGIERLKGQGWKIDQYSIDPKDKRKILPK